ncbi:transglycosylase SLT domain-containing protein [Ramlibacter sp. PS3R-8]|uniref:transglycosylase SLT domain-containing protein n=1 Tax=Ramlibacter sp. PS3R-8 TaxID=3133437 RepID=UPI0030A169EE
MKERIASQVTSIHNAVMLGLLLGAGLSGSIGGSSAPVSDTLARQADKVAVEVAAPAPKAAPAPARFNVHIDAYYEQLRTKLRWKDVRYAGDVLQTPDAQSRLLLVQSAAERAGLEKVGLSYADVYGIINAETSWIPRMGSSKDGTPNLGIAQFEPATARAVGLTDPLDPVQAVHAAAMHLKDAATWSSRRIANLKLTPEEHATKLREGVSIYYNLSSKGRSEWNGLNTAKLPIETQRHIANARLGAREAAEMELQLVQLKSRMSLPGMMTASYRGSGG